MTRERARTGLIALNVVLLLCLFLVTVAPDVRAESGSGRSSGGGGAVAGDYIMVGGEINGVTTNGVYVLDQRSGTLIGLVYDRSTKKMSGLGIKDVGEDSGRTSPSR